MTTKNLCSVPDPSTLSPEQADAVRTLTEYARTQASSSSTPADEDRLVEAIEHCLERSLDDNLAFALGALEEGGAARRELDHWISYLSETTIEGEYAILLTGIPLIMRFPEGVPIPRALPATDAVLGTLYSSGLFSQYATLRLWPDWMDPANEHLPPSKRLPLARDMLGRREHAIGYLPREPAEPEAMAGAPVARILVGCCGHSLREDEPFFFELGEAHPERPLALESRWNDAFARAVAEATGAAEVRAFSMNYFGEARKRALEELMAASA